MTPDARRCARPGCGHTEARHARLHGPSACWDCACPAFVPPSNWRGSLPASAPIEEASPAERIEDMTPEQRGEWFARGLTKQEGRDLVTVERAAACSECGHPEREHETIDGPRHCRTCCGMGRMCVCGPAARPEAPALREAAPLSKATRHSLKTLRKYAKLGISWEGWSMRDVRALAAYVDTLEADNAALRAALGEGER